ncbi:MAG: hypothetical protein AAF517_17790 [Planctomycetota bacterium]
MRRIYHADFQLVKVRGIMYLAMAVGLGALWAAYHIYTTFGLNPADGYGGELAPMAHRAPFAGFVALFGLTFWGGMFMYGRCYAAEISVSDDESEVKIRTLGFIVDRRMTRAASELVDSDFHEGRNKGFFARYLSVNAPWVSVRIRGKRWPLIVDVQGDFLDEGTFDRLFVLKS